jgi:hypothetical protein
MSILQVIATDACASIDGIDGIGAEYDGHRSLRKH